MTLYHLTSRLFVPMLVAIFFSNGCGKPQNPGSGTEQVTFSSVEAVTTTLDELKKRPPFTAVVIEVSTRQNQSGISEGALPSGVMVTNVFALKLRDTAGHTEFVAGVNAVDADVQRINQLLKGKVYRFPDVIVKAAGLEK